MVDHDTNICSALDIPHRVGQAWFNWYPDLGVERSDWIWAHGCNGTRLGLGRSTTVELPECEERIPADCQSPY